MQRSARVRVAVVVALAALAMIALAARSGRTTTVTEMTRGTSVTTPRSTPPDVTASPPPTGEQHPEEDPPSWVVFLVAGLVLAVAAVVIGGLVVLTGGLGRWRLPTRGGPPDDAGRARELAEAEARRLAAAVSDSFALLAEGEPTDAVVACWVALERAAATVGTARRPAETSTELAERIFAEHRVGAEPLRVLGVLYREARYSRHPLGEDARDRARAALERVRADLGVATR